MNKTLQKRAKLAKGAHRGPAHPVKEHEQSGTHNELKPHKEEKYETNPTKGIKRGY